MRVSQNRWSIEKCPSLYDWIKTVVTPTSILGNLHITSGVKNWIVMFFEDMLDYQK